MLRKSNKSLPEFIQTLKPSNIDPRYYYTNYQKIITHEQKFAAILEQLGTVVDQQQFVARLLAILHRDPTAITIVPLFSAISPQALTVLKSHGAVVTKFDHRHVTPDEAIAFLEEVGFLATISAHAPLHLPSYFFGVHVGLDSHGRKNRSGQTMEQAVALHLTMLDLDFVKQATIGALAKVWDVASAAQINDQKRYDFIVKSNDHYYFFECNFFNSAGSKTHVNQAYLTLQAKLKTFSPLFHLVVISDGPGLKKARNETRTIFAKLDYLFNLDDLEQGVLRSLI